MGRPPPDAEAWDSPTSPPRSAPLGPAQRPPLLGAALRPRPLAGTATPGASATGAAPTAPTPAHTAAGTTPPRRDERPWRVRSNSFNAEVPPPPPSRQPAGSTSGAGTVAADPRSRPGGPPAPRGPQRRRSPRGAPAQDDDDTANLPRLVVEPDDTADAPAPPAAAGAAGAAAGVGRTNTGDAAGAAAGQRDRHPAHQLLDVHGFEMFKYKKFHAKCLRGRLPRARPLSLLACSRALLASRGSRPSSHATHTRAERLC